MPLIQILYICVWLNEFSCIDSYVVTAFIVDHLPGGEDKTWKITDKLLVVDNNHLMEYAT